MKIFIIGGTGLLGSAAAQLFIKNGHSVRSVARGPLPEGAPIPEEMELIFKNYMEISDEEIKAMMEGYDCLVFAAGIDERVEFSAPVYPNYVKFNIEPVKRLIGLAKECGLTNTVLLGSYFSYFAREYPEMKLTERHPYIRSRIEQEEVALSMADDNMSVAILQLPYIFGTQSGRSPVWVILIEQLSRMPIVTLYPKGGTAMLTVRQVAQIIVGAAESNKGANIYPISYYNITWNEFLKIVHKAMGKPNRKIIHVTNWMFKLFGKTMMKQYTNNNIDPGLNPVHLADIMSMNTFIDKKWSVALGATDDDINKAIFDSVKLSIDAFTGKQKLLTMKAE